MNIHYEHDDDDVEQYSTTRFKVVQRINDAFVYSLSANQRPPKNVGQEWGRDWGNEDEGCDVQSRQREVALKYMSTHYHTSLPIREEPSPYSTGDVDIFVQPCMLMAKVTKVIISSGASSTISDIIQSYIGKSWTNKGHLQEYFLQLVKKELKSCYEFVEDCEYDGDGGAENIVSVTDRSMSNEFASSIEGGYQVGGVIDCWPRNTQVIQLPLLSNIVLGILDFDLSVASAAYNGSEVLITFRCLYSLLSKINIVTPVVVSESRSRVRMRKYGRRGFPTWVFDPFSWEEPTSQETVQVDEDPSPLHPQRPGGNYDHPSPDDATRVMSIDNKPNCHVSGGISGDDGRREMNENCDTMATTK